MEIAGIVALFVIMLVREYVHQLEKRDDRNERHELIQRIQAPRETAYQEFSESLPEGAPSQPIFSDEEILEALGTMPPKVVDSIEDWNAAMGITE